MARLLNKFEVGCDPEFAIIDAKGALVNLCSLGTAGPVGYDHGGKCAELRPTQARGTWTVVLRLQTLINAPYPKLVPYAPHKWRAGAYVKTEKGTVTLGGHVHFDLPELPRGCGDALDSVTKMLETLEVLPRTESITRRTRSNYGKWSDFRQDSGHVEYRTMASWLRDPWVSFLALTLCKLAVIDAAEAVKLAKAGSIQDITNFLERYKGKDLNVDRLLEKLERDCKWLQGEQDVDIKSAWRRPLGVR